MPWIRGLCAGWASWEQCQAAAEWSREQTASRLRRPMQGTCSHHTWLVCVEPRPGSEWTATVNGQKYTTIRTAEKLSGLPQKYAVVNKTQKQVYNPFRLTDRNAWWLGFTATITTPQYPCIISNNINSAISYHEKRRCRILAFLWTICRKSEANVTVLKQNWEKVTTVAKNTYRCSAPAVWNSLPKTVVNGDSVTVFKSSLETFLFSRAFTLPSSKQHTAWPQCLWSYNLMALYKFTKYLTIIVSLS